MARNEQAWTYFSDMMMAAAAKLTRGAILYNDKNHKVFITPNADYVCVYVNIDQTQRFGEARFGRGNDPDDLAAALKDLPDQILHDMNLALAAIVNG